MDNAENYIRVMGPIEAGSFTLADYTKDQINPTFNGITINKSIVETGEKVGITVNASDDTLVKSVAVNYIKPITNEIETIPLVETGKGTFTKDFYINPDAEYGEWKLSSVEVTDLNGNKTVATDLSDGNFTVLKPIEPLSYRIVNANETWSNQVINGDVYIGPAAILTINGNVQINGNVYVLGALRSFGGLTLNGSLKASSFYFGYRYTLYNGDVSLSGSNSISSMVASSNPLESVPFEIYNTPIIETNGKIDIQGATIPVVDVYLNGQKLYLNSNGTFRVTDYSIGSSKNITFTFSDIFGNIMTKTYKVYNNELPIVSNDKPSGIYMGDQYITLTSSKEGQIYYTLDGSEPTKGSLVYQGPIKLDKSTILKYFAEDEIGNKSTTYINQYSLFSLDEVTNESNMVKGSGEPGLTVTIEVNNQTYVIDSDGMFQLEVPNLKEQTTFLVSASDQAGQTSTQYQMSVKDVIPPTIGGIEQGGIYNADRTITFNEGTATLNGNPFTSGMKVGNDGAYNLEVTDLGGNKTSVEFTIDKTPPKVDGVVSKKIYNQDVAVGFNEGIATLNGNTIISGTILSADGIYTLEVTDPAGNKTSVEFTIDKMDPKVDGVVDKGIYNQDVTVGFNEGIATLNGNTIISGTILSADGTYTLEVTDLAGNKTTLKFIIDKTKPKVDGVKDKGIYNQNVTVTFNEGTATLNGNTIISGTILSADGTYTLEVTDLAGNKITLKFIIDKTKPKVDGVKDKGIYNQNVAVTFNEGTATLNGDAYASGTIVKTDGTYTLEVTDPAGNKTSVEFTIDKTAPKVDGVVDKGIYNQDVAVDFNEGTATLNGDSVTSGMVVTREGTYILEVTDQAGNNSILRFIIDKSAPAIPTISTVSDQTTTITGQAEPHAIVKLFIAGKYQKQSIVDKYGNYKISISRLKANTEIKVNVTDQSGNVGSTRKVIVSDKTPPSKPIVNNVTSKSTYVTGKAEKGTTVYVYKGKTYLGKAVVNNKGIYKVKVKAQKQGTVLTVYAKDPAKNQSNNRSVKVYK